MEEMEMGLFSKLFKNEESTGTEKISVSEEKGCIYSPADGKAVALETLGDGMFSEKILGDGVAVAPSEGKFFAPISGTVETVFPTGHAYGITSADGVEILLHIGLDTVALDGKGFQAHVKQGQQVNAGDLLATVDLDAVKKEGYRVETMVIVTSGNTVENRIDADAEVKAGEKIFETK